MPKWTPEQRATLRKLLQDRGGVVQSVVVETFEREYGKNVHSPGAIYREWRRLLKESQKGPGVAATTNKDSDARSRSLPASSEPAIETENGTSGYIDPSSSISTISTNASSASTNYHFSISGEAALNPLLRDAELSIHQTEKQHRIGSNRALSICTDYEIPHNSDWRVWHDLAFKIPELWT
jgi:hypothetical protein